MHEGKNIDIAFYRSFGSGKSTLLCCPLGSEHPSSGRVFHDNQNLADLATRAVIAHRLTTIMSADRILVMDRGRIVQSGSYRQLVDQPGLFQDLAKRQLI